MADTPGAREFPAITGSRAKRDPPVAPYGAADFLSDASRQLRALAALSGSLTDPLTPAEAAEVVEQQALACLGATSAVVMTLGQFPPAVIEAADSAGTASAVTGPALAGAPSALILLHAIGVPSDLENSLRELRLDADVPLSEVARTGKPVFLGSEADLQRYPAWYDALLTNGSKSAAAVPVWANGHLRGVLGLTWCEPRVFDADERAFVLTIGVMGAQAIMRGYLAVAEQQARRTAEHANAAKTHFLRTMSHELRTPLTAVIGYAELLEDEVAGPTTELQRDHIARIRRSSIHLLSLIEELLDFAQIEAGELLVREQNLRAGDVIEDTLDITRPMAEAKNMAIRVTGSHERIDLRTDRVKLRQILVNLVTNAVKYSDRGDVSIEVVTEGAGHERVVIFAVTDTGHGIAAGDHQKIFEPFWRVDQSLTRRTGGSGLGLSVARELARLLGGDIILSRSELGQGSTFTAMIPAILRAKGSDGGQ